MYSEKATKFHEIFTLLLTGTTGDKSNEEISQNFVAFSEYMNFTIRISGQLFDQSSDITIRNMKRVSLECKKNIKE